MIIWIDLKWGASPARTFFAQCSVKLSAKLESMGYWSPNLATGTVQLSVLILSSFVVPATKLSFSGSVSSGAFVEKGVPNLMTGQLASL